MSERSFKDKKSTASTSPKSRLDRIKIDHTRQDIGKNQRSSSSLLGPSPALASLLETSGTKGSTKPQPQSTFSKFLNDDNYLRSLLSPVDKSPLLSMSKPAINRMLRREGSSIISYGSSKLNLMSSLEFHMNAIHNHTAGLNLTALLKDHHRDQSMMSDSVEVGSLMGSIGGLFAKGGINFLNVGALNDIPAAKPEEPEDKYEEAFKGLAKDKYYYSVSMFKSRQEFKNKLKAQPYQKKVKQDTFNAVCEPTRVQIDIGTTPDRPASLARVPAPQGSKPPSSKSSITGTESKEGLTPSKEPKVERRKSKNSKRQHIPVSKQFAIKPWKQVKDPSIPEHPNESKSMQRDLSSSFMKNRLVDKAPQTSSQTNIAPASPAFNGNQNLLHSSIQPISSAVNMLQANRSSILQKKTVSPKRQAVPLDASSSSQLQHKPRPISSFEVSYNAKGDTRNNPKLKPFCMFRKASDEHKASKPKKATIFIRKPSLSSVTDN